MAQLSVQSQLNRSHAGRKGANSLIVGGSAENVPAEPRLYHPEVIPSMERGFYFTVSSHSTSGIASWHNVIRPFKT